MTMIGINAGAHSKAELHFKWAECGVMLSIVDCIW